MAEETASGTEGQSTGTTTTTTETGAGAGATLLQTDTSLLDYRNVLPENLRTAGIIQQHATVESLAKAAIEQASLIGRGVYLPKAAKGSDEYLSGMQKVLGKIREFDPDYAPPEKADGYSWAAPEGREVTGDTVTRWNTRFHSLGLTQQQAQALMNGFFQDLKDAEQVRDGRDQESYQEGRNALFKEFGANTERELSLAQAFVNHFGAGAFSGEAGTKFWEQMKDAVLPDGSRLINSPYLVATFANAQRRIGEGEYLESPYYQAGKNTMETIEARFRELGQKLVDRTITQTEQQEWQQLSERISQHRQRQSGQRVA